jgi:hypothetical protein
MLGAPPLFPHMSSRSGTLLSTWTTLPLPFYSADSLRLRSADPKGEVAVFAVPSNCLCCSACRGIGMNYCNSMEQSPS